MQFLFRASRKSKSCPMPDRYCNNRAFIPLFVRAHHAFQPGQVGAP